jgi:hypothetical protein
MVVGWTGAPADIGHELLSNCQTNVDANRGLLAAGGTDGDGQDDAGGSCVRVRELDWSAALPTCDAGAASSTSADDDANLWRWTAADRELCVPLPLGLVCDFALACGAHLSRHLPLVRARGEA